MPQSSKPAVAPKARRPHKSGDKRSDAQRELDQMLTQQLALVISAGTQVGFALLTQFLSKKLGGTTPSPLDSKP